MSRYHLQLCEREFVIWGRGPRPSEESLRGCEISPAVVTVRLPNGDIPVPFSPPPEGREYERRTCWGWRFRGVSNLDTTPWRLAPNREACLHQAKRRIASLLEHEPHEGRQLQTALADVREYYHTII